MPSKTGIKGVKGIKRVKGWSSQQPGYHQRTIMKRKCGKKMLPRTK